MLKSRLFLLGSLALVVCLAGCADGASNGGADQGTTVAAQTAQPVATIQIAEQRRLEFYASGNDVLVVQNYPVGEGPILNDADKQLSAPDLYRKFAPSRSEIPGSLYGAAEPSDEDVAVPEGNVSGNAAGGGQPVPEASVGGVEHVSSALSLGEGCHPTQSTAVFADCRNHWFGGYFAFAVPTWFLDSRVEALSGSLDERFTSQYGGGTFVNQFHVPQGQVSNVHFPKARVCKTILGITVSCSDTKAARRLDVINASNTTFNVDVVFFN